MDNCKIYHTNTLQDVLTDAGLYSIMFDGVNMHSIISIIHPQLTTPPTPFLFSHFIAQTFAQW